MVISDIGEFEHFKHVPAIQNWIRTQAHLPQNISKLNQKNYFAIYF